VGLGTTLRSGELAGESVEGSGRALPMTGRVVERDFRPASWAEVIRATDDVDYGPKREEITEELDLRSAEWERATAVTFRLNLCEVIAKGAPNSIKGEATGTA